MCLGLVMEEEKVKEHGPSADLSDAILTTELRLAQSDVRKELRIVSQPKMISAVVTV